MPIQTGKAAWTIIDYQGQKSNVGIRGVTMTAANHDAQLALVAALRTAVFNVQLGNIIKDATTAVLTYWDPAPSADPDARRELKWRGEYYDSTTWDVYDFEVPCADMSLTDPLDRRQMDLSAGAGLALKTAFEAYAVSPGGHACVLTHMWVVGRNI
jgi:hypothetical protein